MKTREWKLTSTNSDTRRKLMVRGMRSWYILDRRSDDPGTSMDVERKKTIAPHVQRRIQEIQPSTSHAVGCSIPAQNPILYLGADLGVW
jgi:hypothetical protein